MSQMKFSSKILACAALASGLVSAAAAAVETYTIDPVHSSVGFTIRHAVGRVPGRFTKFSGTIVVDRDNLENSTVNATIDVGSIDTDNDKRNGHLRTADFFDVEKYATITFKSKSWKKTGDGTFDVTGDLTIKDTTKEVVLNVTLNGFGPGMKGATLSGWEATTTLNRTDFGVNGPAMLGKMLGDEVAVTILIEADMPAPADATKM
jgi:polyisoprenoid-binding protein YceI